MRRRITTAKREEIEKEQKLLDSTIVRPFESLQGLPISYSRPPGQYEDILKNPLTVKDSAVLYNSLLRSRNTFVHHAPMFKLHWVRQTAYAKKLAEMDKEKQKEVLEERDKRRFAKATSNSLEAHFRQPVLTPEINARDVMSKLCESSITLGPHTMDIRIYIAKDARSDKSKRGQPLAPGPGDQTISLNRAFLTLPPLESTQSAPSEQPSNTNGTSLGATETSMPDSQPAPEGTSDTKPSQTSHTSVANVTSSETNKESEQVQSSLQQPSSTDNPENVPSQKIGEESTNQDANEESSKDLQREKDVPEFELRKDASQDEKLVEDDKMEIDEAPVSLASPTEETKKEEPMLEEIAENDAKPSTTDSETVKEEGALSDNEAVKEEDVIKEKGDQENVAVENDSKESDSKENIPEESPLEANGPLENNSAETQPNESGNVGIESNEESANEDEDHEETIQKELPLNAEEPKENESMEVEGVSAPAVSLKEKADEEENQSKAPDEEHESNEEEKASNETEEVTDLKVDEEEQKPTEDKEIKKEDQDEDFNKEDVKKEDDEEDPGVKSEETPPPPKRRPGRPPKRGRPRKVPVEEPPARNTDGPRRLSRLQQEASKPPPAPPLPSPSPSPPPRRRYKRRGRPPKNPRPETTSEEEEEEESPEPEPQPKIKRGRGRPRIHPIVEPKKEEEKDDAKEKTADGKDQKETGTVLGRKPPNSQGVQAPSRPPANLQSLENVIMISNLNTIAETDLSLNGLMQRVASGQAPEEEVNKFKGYIEQARRMGPQPHHADLFFKHGLPLPPNFPKVYPAQQRIEPSMSYPQRQNAAPKLTAFQERYLYNATLVIEFHENANVRYIIPQDSICDVLPPEKAPPEDTEEGMEYKDVLFSHMWIHNMDEVLRFEKDMEEYDKELVAFKKEQEEKKKLAEENEKRVAEGLPILEEPVSNEPRASRTKKKASGSQKVDDGPALPKDPSLKFTTYSFTLHNIPTKYVPIVINSVKPAPEIRERMQKILRTGTRIPSHFLWYRVDARLDEKFAESLRCKAVEEEMNMPGYVPPVEPKKRKTPQIKNPKQKKMKEESPDARPLVQGYPLTAKGYTPVLNTGVTGPETPSAVMH